MAKLKQLFSVIFVLTQWSSYAQSYLVQYIAEDSTVLQQKAALQTQFFSRNEASLYILRLPALLQGRGFLTASVDSMELDSASAKVRLFLGEQYQWARITIPSQSAAVLEAVHWNEKTLGGLVDFISLQSWQKKVLDYLEESGHPFGKVY
ncbi:MAG TPA: hypothetical protein VFS22_03665, partial [Flavisolibacter sp.]|nr:hypothetical protein [Flavisolibacter sp.]